MNAKTLLAVFGDAEGFSKFCDEVASNSKKAQVLSKIVAEFPQNKRGELWRNLLQAVREHGPGNPKVFSLGCVFIDAWLDASDKEQIPPANLIDLVAESHDALFELHGESEVQEQVSNVCERWYLELRPGRDRVLPQLIPTVILKSLQLDGSPGRAYSLRETLTMFDMDDESSLPLKKLLIQCFVSPAHLNSNQGRKFLSFVMALSDELLFAAHDSIKNQLLALRNLKSEKRADAISNFARVYSGVWQNLKREKQAEDEELREKKNRLLEAFEVDIVQRDFMNSCIFCEDEQLGKICLKLLNAAFHDNKKDRSVDSMLARRYEPLIWRGLGAVNASVRKNAAVVLFNAFPLHDPEAKLEDISRSLQRQFDAISTLLIDPCPDVRITAIEGTCRVLALYWETIPTQKSSKYLQTMVNDLAHDRSSPPVRAAVLRSLAYMLDYPLSQEALKMALPHLRRHLNDRSVIVRAEMAKLLVKVDSTTGFNFTNICSPSSILNRLVEDKDLSGVIIPLCQLLAPSFYPVDAPSVEQLKRAKSLATTNFAASQVFFRNLYRFVDVNKVAKLALLFGSFIRARKREMESAEFEREEEKLEETKKAIEEIHIAVETVCALWGSIAKPVNNSPHYASAKESLNQTFAHDAFIFGLFEWKEFCEQHEPSLLKLCVLVPPGGGDDKDLNGSSSGNQAAASALERRIIRGIFLAKETTSLALERKVDLVVEWNRHDRVVREIARSLTVYVNQEKDVKRKVNPQAAVRVLNQLILSLSEKQAAGIASSVSHSKRRNGAKASKKTHDAIETEEAVDDEEKMDHDVGMDAEVAEETAFENNNWLGALSSNEGLGAVFELVRPKVGAGVLDEVLLSIALLELKLGVHSYALRLLASTVATNSNTIATPGLLVMAIEWCTGKIYEQDMDFLTVAQGSGNQFFPSAKVLKKAKDDSSKQRQSTASSAASRLFADVDDDDVDDLEQDEPLITTYFGGVIQLAHDTLALGIDVYEPSIALIDSALSAGLFAQLVRNGLDRLLYQLKVNRPEDERVDSLIQGAYHACNDSDASELTEHLVVALSQKFPERTFKNIIMPLFRQGLRLFVGRPVSLMKSFTCALAALRVTPEDDSLFQAVQYFARGAYALKSVDVHRELVRFSERSGGMVGDMLFNLAHELHGEAAA